MPDDDDAQDGATDPALVAAREAFAGRRWVEAYDGFAGVEPSALTHRDLEQMGWAAALFGRHEVMHETHERLFHALQAEGQCLPAARIAFWIGFWLLTGGEPARGSAWVARARRIVEREDRPCAEAGYIRVPDAERHLAEADYEAALADAKVISEVGEQFDDRDLVTLARMAEGRALVRSGSVGPGLAALDEAMLAASSDELSPQLAGMAYCEVISTCRQAQALDRAREWTSALGRWCDTQPQLMTFLGSCLVHRAEVLQLSGEWGHADDEARAACERFENAEYPGALGGAYYQRGEIHRLRGEVDQAEQAYAEASRHGREPQPGLALLRLQQGRAQAAAAAMRGVLEARSQPLDRARFLPAFVEAMLAVGDLDEAQRGADELGEIAGRFQHEIMAAIAAQAAGAVRLARGDAAGALKPLREAFATWHGVGAPYHAAQLRSLIARACTALSDADGAKLELDAARRVFAELGAKADLAALDAAASPAAVGASATDHGLTPREREVLQLVAQGKTNKQIAAALHISERTVDRHLSNMFNKLGLTSRSAVTAFAYQHGLV